MLPSPQRLTALDWMRGFVMALMAIDHAGLVDPNHLFTDSVTLYDPGTPLPFWHVITRWITHLCAPTFVFLAGVSMALSIGKRQIAGISAREMDSHLLKRGLILIAFDTFFIDPFGQQVLFALGMGIISMIPLRRLGFKTMLVAGLGILVGGEVIINLAYSWSGADPHAVKGVVSGMMNLSGPDMAKLTEIRDLQPAIGWFALITPFLYPGVTVWLGPLPILIIYPFVPWLGMMMLGWAFGTLLIRHRNQPETAPDPGRVLLVGGSLSLCLFAILRGLNGYGNMGLLREDASLVQWLHVSKYPPSLTFAALELGLMSLCLYLFIRYEKTLTGPPRQGNPLRVFGQTALFFYLLHQPILAIVGGITGLTDKMGLGGVYLFTIGILVVMYPLCIWYRRYKAQHPTNWTRYI